MIEAATLTTVEIQNQLNTLKRRIDELSSAMPELSKKIANCFIYNRDYYFEAREWDNLYNRALQLEAEYNRIADSASLPHLRPVVNTTANTTSIVKKETSKTITTAKPKTKNIEQQEQLSFWHQQGVA